MIASSDVIIGILVLGPLYGLASVAAVAALGRRTRGGRHS